MSLVELQPAYLLHLRHYRDTSALVELLTPGFGRVGAVMRGVYGTGRKAARTRALLQPFVTLAASWQGRGELKTLRDIDGRLDLALAGERLYAGLYVNELTLRLLHRNDPHPECFSDYRQCLQTLAGEGVMEPVLRRYELRLLESLGYGVVLDCEADSGRSLEEDAWYHYVPEHGLVRCDPSSANSRLSWRGADLLAMAREEWSADVLLTAKRLCRQLLQPLLGAEPLRSRELFMSRQS